MATENAPSIDGHDSNVSNAQIKKIIDTIRHVKETSENVVNFRKEAGKKSLWSAHKTIKEERLFTNFSNACATLTENMTAILPDHWKMNKWVFVPHRKGDAVRWAGNLGKLAGGAILKTQYSELATWAGIVVGAVGESQKIKKEDRARLEKVSIKNTDISSYLFSFGYYSLQGTGKVPTIPSPK